MSIEETFAQLFGNSPLQATFAAANAITKVLLESLLPSDANRLLCNSQAERELFGRLVREIEIASGEKTVSLQWKDRVRFIHSLDRALTYSTRKTIGINPLRAKRGLATLRKIHVDLV